MTEFRSVRPLGLAAITLANAGDGLAHAARLFHRACANGLAGGVRTIELGSDRPEHVSIARRLRFTSELLRIQLARRVSGVLFTHAGIARAQTLVPGWTRRPYGVVLNGIEAWDADLTADRQRAIREASIRIAISHYTARRVREAHPDLGAIVACPLALGPEGPADEEDVDHEVLARIEPRSVLIVGRMSAAERYKGHDQLLEVWPAVVSRTPDAQLVVVGKGDDADRLRRKAGDLGVSERVLFTGFLAEPTLRAVRDRVAVFGMPSTGEGFGLVYLEAMRAGLPCIGSREDAAADIIRNEETGLLIASGDASALCAAIVALLENEELRRGYGAAGLRRFQSEYAMDRFAARFIPLLMPLTTS